MSASFYDLLKYAKTGIAAPDMTAYDKMRAVAMAGGKVKTLTGVPPLSFTGNGKPLISWSMLGNGQQNGTPAPDAPIMPELVGEKTINLYDDTSTVTLPIGVRYGMVFEPGVYSIWNDTDNKVYSFNSDGYGRLEACQPHSTATVLLTQEGGSTTKSGFFMPNDDTSLGGVTIVSGSTPPDHYIPYGFQIPITNAGQTVPVYLGQVQTTRKIKKLVFDGTEDWSINSNQAVFVLTGITQGYYDQRHGITCSHLIQYEFYYLFDRIVEYGIAFGARPADRICIRVADYENDIPAFKQWLAEQYAAGTPVTVWYVLAEPTTGIVNEPLAKIGTYADTLHSTDAGVSIPTTRGQNTLTVDTDLQPSSMTITYR